ncbi:MAG: AAA family ATPase [Thermoleophilia bacterium]|nr:AAA family ATPase [Thermoleophilia bacterium]
MGELLRGDARLVTLTGPGGTGKTRLAIQTAHELADRFADGVTFVALAALRDPGLVLAEIAVTLEVAGGRDSESALADHLRDRAELLVIDNFEQVDEAAPALGFLLSAAPALKLLVTSRHALRLYGEHDFPVAPLTLDDEAVPLFLERARASGRSVDACEDVREICRRLDCLPLAIELAAARARELPPAELRRLLADRLELASGGPRDAPARQRTLRATIEWSYDLLARDERRLFAALAVFSGGFTHAAAEAVADASVRALEALAAKSLLVDADGRLGMLETIREYALERLAEAGDAGALARRHAAFFVDLAVQAKPALRSADARTWLERLEAEHDNLRAALDWSLTHEPDWFLRLVDALFLFWSMRGHHREGLRWYERARHVAEPAPRAHADALKLGAGFAYQCRDFRLARSLGESALALYGRLGDTANQARTLTLLGLVATQEGEHALARARLDEGVALARASGDEEVLSFALTNLGYVALETGEPERARTASLEALDLLRRSPPERERPSELGAVLGNLACAALFEGRPQEAGAHLRESLALRIPIRDLHGIASALTGVAAVAAEEGAHEAAARLLGAVDAVCERADLALEPVDAELYARAADAARRGLGEGELAAAREEGRALEPEDAAALVLGGDPGRGEAGATVRA